MNLDFIKTKKEMLDFAESKGVELTSTKLKDMKLEYSTKELQPIVDFAALEANTVIQDEPIMGDSMNVTITSRDGIPIKTLSYADVAEYVSALSLRWEDVEKVIDKSWLNVGGYTFTTKG